MQAPMDQGKQVTGENLDERVLRPSNDSARLLDV